VARAARAPLRAATAPTVTQTFDQATTGFNKINDYEFGTNSGWKVNNLTDLADHGLGKIILALADLYGGLRLYPTTRVDSQSAGRESKFVFP
jgi:hypothetical protein